MSTNGRESILLLWSNPKERRSLYKILCATGVEEVVYGESKNLDTESLRAHRLVVVDYDSLGGLDASTLSALEASATRPAILVVSSFRERDKLLQLFAHQGYTNFLGKNQDLGANDLFITAQKILRNDVFGMDKYLNWGVEIRRTNVQSSNQKQPLVDELEGYLQLIGCNRRLVELAKTVADEFLTNAIYNAPVDASGQSKYASLSRTEEVQLTDAERAEFSYACDGRLLALSISDNFGRLDSETVLSYIRKGLEGGEDQIDQKQGGAGLGLYYIYESLNHLVVNLSPNKKTEIIGIIDISGSYKDFVAQAKSLNLFLEESS